MAFLIVEHKVKDFASWKPLFVEHAAVRNKHGLRNVRVYQADGDRNMVCVIAEGEGPKIQAFLEDPTLKPAMEKAGVVGVPTISIVEALTATA